MSKTLTTVAGDGGGCDSDDDDSVGGTQILQVMPTLSDYSDYCCFFSAV